MTVSIKKAIIPISAPRRALYPLEVCVEKELFPVGEVPAIYHMMDELVECGVEKVIFLLPSEKKDVVNHFKELDRENRYSSLDISYFSYKKGMGMGSVLSKAKAEVDEDDFFLLFPDMIFSGKKYALQQILNPYRTSKKMILGLAEVEEERVSEFYIAETEKIANRFYKIKKILKKPTPADTDSRLALVPRYIFSPLIFDHLAGSGKEVLFDAINSMIASGKTIYGYACDGKWHSLKDKENLLETQRFFVNQLKEE